jgi:threonine/homoserine/homoserine lactone efflux protein
MTITASDLALYAGALFILFLTPGPVWVAVIARAATGGFQAAWPPALGVVVGDVLWPFFAILGVAWIVSVFEGFMVVLRWVASGMFLVMGRC